MTQTASTTRTFDAETLMRIKSAVAARPEPGQSISGTIVVIVPRTSDFGKYPVIVLDTGEDRYTAVHAFHQIAEQQLRELKVAPGQDITMRYDGKVQSKTDDGKGGKRSYHVWTVVPADGGDVEVYDFGAPTPTDEPGF
jgi:hypothetical protein